MQLPIPIFCSAVFQMQITARWQALQPLVKSSVSCGLRHLWKCSFELWRVFCIKIVERMLHICNLIDQQPNVQSLGRLEIESAKWHGWHGINIQRNDCIVQLWSFWDRVGRGRIMQCPSTIAWRSQAYTPACTFPRVFKVLCRWQWTCWATLKTLSHSKRRAHYLTAFPEILSGRNRDRSLLRLGSSVFFRNSGWSTDWWNISAKVKLEEDILKEKKRNGTKEIKLK